ncbi:MAG: glutathione synthase [Candidatus Azotimanducaceae bacterium]|jgi:glutathione synthase
MKQITFLIQDSDALEDGNYLRFSNELLERGFEVYLCKVDSLSMQNSQICAEGFKLSEQIFPGGLFPRLKTIELQNMACIWVLGLGLRNNFLDKLQLIYCLENYCRVINSSNSILNLKSKYSLACHSDSFAYPQSYSSTDPKALFAVIEGSGHKWIAKPPAGSMGRDIFLLSADDPNAQVILETMTGPQSDQYCLIQAYVDEIQAGEKRVIFAAGEAVGQYLRLQNKDHRTNLVQGAEIQPSDLNLAEQESCKKIGQFLLSQGADYVGVDLVYPYVIEMNVINPGGLLTIESLTGKTLTSDIINKIFPDDI